MAGRSSKEHDLREAIGRAVAAGIAYLSQTMHENGAWPTNVYNIHAPFSSSQEHYPPFIVALGAVSLDTCGHPDAAPMAARSRAYLHDVVEPRQLWRYIHFVPPDTDDTAICSMATGPHAVPLANVESILAQRDGAGRFRTWIPTPEDPVELFNEADPVVNANIVAYLGDRPETRPALNWLREVGVETSAQIADIIHYYPDPLDLDIALARASELQAPLLAELRQPVLDRILACQGATGEFVDAMHTGQALTALDRLGELRRAEAIRPAVERLLETQRANGSWPACVACPQEHHQQSAQTDHHQANPQTQPDQDTHHHCPSTYS